MVANYKIVNKFKMVHIILKKFKNFITLNSEEIQHFIYHYEQVQNVNKSKMLIEDGF